MDYVEPTWEELEDLLRTAAVEDKLADIPKWDYEARDEARDLTDVQLLNDMEWEDWQEYKDKD